MLVGVDWGTSRLRAYLLSPGGVVVDQIEADKGLLSVAPGRFEAVLREAILPFKTRPAETLVLMSGMVGSRQGWAEAPYVALPASLDDLASTMLTVAAPSLGKVAIVPGVMTGSGRSAWADVMRGEETQVFGALLGLDAREGRFVLPGSHSKWVDVEDGAIVGFTTYMTGEIYAALTQHTILSKMMGEGGRNGDAFARGVEAARGLSQPGDLLARFFNVRAETLLGRLDPDDAPDFLSGLLIGAEVGAATQNVQSVVIVGSEGLTERYRQALELLGVRPVVAPERAAAVGLAQIAERWRANRSTSKASQH
ncbi:MAG: 2-dehydro-3-deoxygalactonokinase [Pseudomonadota bacterium]